MRDNACEIEPFSQLRMHAVRRVCPVALIAAGLAALAALPATAAAGRLDPPTWADEFTGTELDSTRWAPRATGVRHDGILTPDAFDVGDGVLTITTYTEDDRHYSGMLSTAGGSVGLQQRYGYFEARVKFASAPGQWSAFWLQSPTIGNPVGDPATAGGRDGRHRASHAVRECARADAAGDLRAAEQHRGPCAAGPHLGRL